MCCILIVVIETRLWIHLWNSQDCTQRVNFTICRLHLNKPYFEKPQTHYFISYSCGIDPRKRGRMSSPFLCSLSVGSTLRNVLCLIAWVRAPLNTSGWLRPPRIIISLWKLVLAYPYLTLGKGSVGQCFPLGTLNSHSGWNLPDGPHLFEWECSCVCLIHCKKCDIIHSH